MSPLLFAAAADVLLRRLQRLCPDVVFRAYADDLAAVVPAVTSSLPRLARIFGEFAQISGLHVNMAKTVFVPLFLGDLEVIIAD